MALEIRPAQPAAARPSGSGNARSTANDPFSLDRLAAQGVSPEASRSAAPSASESPARSASEQTPTSSSPNGPSGATSHARTSASSQRPEPTRSLGKRAADEPAKKSNTSPANEPPAQSAASSPLARLSKPTGGSSPSLADCAQTSAVEQQPEAALTADAPTTLWGSNITKGRTPGRQLKASADAASAIALQNLPPGAHAAASGALTTTNTDSAPNLLPVLAGAADPQAAIMPEQPAQADSSASPAGKGLPGDTANTAGLALAAQTAVAALSAGSAATPSPAPVSAASDPIAVAPDASAVKPLNLPLAAAAAETRNLDALLAGSDPTASNTTTNTGTTDATTANAASAGINPALAHLATTPHIAMARELPTTVELRSHIGSAAWDDELGSQLTWMTHQGIQSASLRLSPEHLGPLEVSISVQNGNASVWFGAAHADTRAALERALPHLRQMFANQGLTLADSGVSREPPRNPAQSPPSVAVGAVTASPPPPGTSNANSAYASVGLIDTYA